MSGMFPSKPVSVREGATYEADYAGAKEIPDGSITVEFEDGTYAVFTAFWHNDSTAGLYISTGVVPRTAAP